ncbi:restriction endonuclease subunit S [Polaribacter sp. Hel_I_88]|uniref:restriction endonuclease subunit S n=1 Tax=Polaribacter sp. Hel_I_88 TaxID=1250006 RepID=UPI000689B7C4|nr:restriction endonuclease subunit S [Polaribacter sp. Hel_I_88]
MDKRENQMPLIRFPEFNEGWEHKQLNELLTVSKKKNKDLKYSKEEVLSVSGELGIVNQIEHLGRSYAGASVHNYGVVEFSDMVYTKSPLKANPYGIIKLNKHKAGIVSTLYAVYKVNEKANGQFIEHYFSLDANLNRYLRPLVRKGAKNTLQITDEESIKGKLFLPQLEEQKRITHFFNILDKKINQLQEKSNNLERYKKGIMQKIFSQKLRFKTDNGDSYPEWEEFNLGELIVYRNGKAHEKDISEDGHFIVVNSKFISQEGKVKKYSKTQICKLEKGEITMVMSDVPNGKALAKCFYVDKNDTYTLNQRICALKPVKIHSKFLIYILNRNRYYLMFDSGVGQTNLTKSEVLSCPLYIPKSEKEQARIANFLTKVDNKINAINEQIESAKTYKKALLQQMFCY